jgi:hypothetical protein
MKLFWKSALKVLNAVMFDVFAFSLLLLILQLPAPSIKKRTIHHKTG